MLGGVSCEDFSLRRNDKLGGFVMCVLTFFVELLAKISPYVEMTNIVITLRGLRLRSA